MDSGLSSFSGLNRMAQIDNSRLYADLAGLNEIKVQGRKNTPEAMREVARQFESLFLNMLLKTMRDSNKVFSEDNYFSSYEMDFHQQNFDNQLSVSLAEGHGIGLADVLYEQLMQRYNLKQNPVNNSLDDNGAKAFPLKTNEGFSLGANADAVPINLFSSPEDFVRKLYHAAESVAEEIGVDPKVLLAQAALETGWGKKIIQKQDGESSHNLFGIKADRDWSGEQVEVNTLEYRDGVAQKERASFRSYGSYEESFKDYVDFLQSSPRYQNALKHADNAESFAEGLQQAGYATDPIYAQKIKRVLNSDTMQVALATNGLGI